MAENSKIEWCDHTWNPWRGCTKVSPGCANCYAEALSKRTGHGEYKRGVPRERLSEDNWRKPISWNNSGLWCEKCRGQKTELPISSLEGHKFRRPRVFCASLADWLDDEVPIEWLADLLKLIHATPNLDWLLLTKRPENWFSRLAKLPLDRYPTSLQRWVMAWLWGDPPPSNVWLGTTVEDQKRADERIPELVKIPAKVRFLSCEPLLEPIEFSNVSRRSDCVSVLGKKALEGIHWVIGGLESGPKRRWGAGIEGLRSLRDQCRAAGVSFFCKQIDKVQPIPEDLMIREFPKA